MIYNDVSNERNRTLQTGKNKYLLFTYSGYSIDGKDYSTEENIVEGLELGADDYITKPFNFDLLKLRIQKIVEWKERSHVSFSQKLDVSPAEITITSLDEALIAKAIKVVEEHISYIDFSVETLSIALGLSHGHLYKKLIAITGKGLIEFIRTVRLKRGRQLLEKSQMQIAEIAYEVDLIPRKDLLSTFGKNLVLCLLNIYVFTNNNNTCWVNYKK